MDRLAITTGILALAFSQRGAGYLALGLSLLAVGISILALVRVTAVARAQSSDLTVQAGDLVDLKGRADLVERKLGGGGDEPA